MLFRSGEGDTPLLPQLRLGKALGVARLATKAEGLNPTGSFKARGMSVAVSRGLELGATSFVAPSAGDPAGGLPASRPGAGGGGKVGGPTDPPAASRGGAQALGARGRVVGGPLSAPRPGASAP